MHEKSGGIVEWQCAVHHALIGEVEAALRGSGMEDVEIAYAGNGVEARARKKRADP